jgi:hypothetical protein
MNSFYKKIISIGDSGDHEHRNPIVEHSDTIAADNPIKSDEHPVLEPSAVQGGWFISNVFSSLLSGVGNLWRSDPILTDADKQPIELVSTPTIPTINPSEEFHMRFRSEIEKDIVLVRELIKNTIEFEKLPQKARNGLTILSDSLGSTDDLGILTFQIQDIIEDGLGTPTEANPGKETILRYKQILTDMLGKYQKLEEEPSALEEVAVPQPMPIVVSTEQRPVPAPTIAQALPIDLTAQITDIRTLLPSDHAKQCVRELRIAFEEKQLELTELFGNPINLSNGLIAKCLFEIRELIPKDPERAEVISFNRDWDLNRAELKKIKDDLNNAIRKYELKILAKDIQAKRWVSFEAIADQRSGWVDADKKNEYLYKLIPGEVIGDLISMGGQNAGKFEGACASSSLNVIAERMGVTVFVKESTIMEATEDMPGIATFSVVLERDGNQVEIGGDANGMKLEFSQILAGLNELGVACTTHLFPSTQQLETFLKSPVNQQVEKQFIIDRYMPKGSFRGDTEASFIEKMGTTGFLEILQARLSSFNAVPDVNYDRYFSSHHLFAGIAHDGQLRLVTDNDANQQKRNWPSVADAKHSLLPDKTVYGVLEI